MIDKLESINSMKIGMFLNLHLYLYRNNFSERSFKDNSGKSLPEPMCNFTSLNKRLEDVEVDNEFCIHVSPSKKVTSVICSSSQGLNSGFICKKCRPNVYTHTNDNGACVAVSLLSSNSSPQPPSSNESLICLYLMLFCVLVIIILTIALLIVLFRNHRTRERDNQRVKGACGETMELKESPPPLPTSDPPYDRCAAGNELPPGEPDTGETKAPHKTGYGTGLVYRPDPTYAEPTDFTNAVARSAAGAPANPIGLRPTPPYSLE